MNYKGEVNELPSEANEGDVYKVIDTIKTNKIGFNIQGVKEIEERSDLGGVLIEIDPETGFVLKYLFDLAIGVFGSQISCKSSWYDPLEENIYISELNTNVYLIGSANAIHYFENNKYIIFENVGYKDYINENVKDIYPYFLIYPNNSFIVYNGKAWDSIIDKTIFPFNSGTGEQSVQSANTKGLGNYSAALGYETQAGAYAFDFDLTHTYTEEDIAARKYYLTSVEGIEVGLTYTIVLNNNYDFKGTIESIGDNYVTVPEGVYVSPISEAPHSGSYLLFPEKPTIGTKIIGTGTAAFGYSAKALGLAAGAEGYNTIASGKYSHAEGRDTKAGYGAHAEGNSSFASGNGAHAEGFKTTATAAGAHAEGQYTTATTVGAHAEGKDSKATGSQAHAEGLNTEASGSQSHAEGTNTFATAYGSHAEGVETNAEGQGAHSEGYKTLAKGPYSHAEGSETQALSAWTHSEGVGTIARGNAQHVQGKYNIEDHGQTIDGSWSNKYAHIIGNGKSDTERSNAHTLDWEGNGWFAGNVETKHGKVVTEKVLGSITPVYQAIQTPTGKIYSGLRASISPEVVTENKISFLRLRPVLTETTGMVLDCYSFTIPFKKDKYCVKLLMRTNQKVNPYFRALQATYSDGSSAVKNIYANKTSSGQNKWEEFIFEVEGTTGLDGQFKQCHIHFAGKDKGGSAFGSDAYFDILGWAVFNSVEDAKAHTFNLDVIDSQTTVIDYLKNNKANVDLSNIPNDVFRAKAEAAGIGGEASLMPEYADIGLSNVPDEVFIAKARALGFMTKDEITAYINEVILGGQW